MVMPKSGFYLIRKEENLFPFGNKSLFHHRLTSSLVTIAAEIPRLLKYVVNTEYLLDK
jgi:hypothetical protein